METVRSCVNCYYRETWYGAPPCQKCGPEMGYPRWCSVESGPLVDKLWGFVEKVTDAAQGACINCMQEPARTADGCKSCPMLELAKIVKKGV